MKVLVLNKTKIIGFLILLSFIFGVLSVSPGVDTSNYLTEAALHSNQTIAAALNQFILALIYISIALLFYPVIANLNKNLALVFLSYRIIAATLMVVGTAILLSILLLSQGYVNGTRGNPETLNIIGNVLKYTRDYFNHVFMVLILGVSNLILFYLFFKSRLIPSWLSIGGVIGTLLSMMASVLLMFQMVEVITTEYLILNAPAGMIELILGIWLLWKGLRPGRNPYTYPIKNTD